MKEDLQNLFDEKMEEKVESWFSDNGKEDKIKYFDNEEFQKATNDVIDSIRHKEEIVDNIFRIMMKCFLYFVKKYDLAKEERKHAVLHVNALEYEVKKQTFINNKRAELYFIIETVLYNATDVLNSI